MHRFVWDVHYEPPAVLRLRLSDLGDAAQHGEGADRRRGLLPGTYTVRLTVDGRTLEQPLVVKMDPRVKTPESVWARQHQLSLELTAALERDYDAIRAVRSLRAQLAALQGRASGGLARAIESLDGRVTELDGGRGLEILYRPERPARPASRHPAGR